ncbi:uncharacterized protein N7483_004291 [Penicillium malachiteum]|uniref:uncharacterized protein n=1 Tax=Penicillium malachiteum TaxID=1324776 RepID=UPI0025471B48|nr:uncharacterized protein N7483_004291 [Penicillium malachiteum]KAJ5729783.1 hypothetical protein N7483_004291 [Penicillium malachiteum]
MENLIISDEALTGSIQDKVILITGVYYLLSMKKGASLIETGGSAGIGRATAQLCLDLGAYVVVGDMSTPNPPFQETDKLKFLEVNVIKWESLRNLFVEAEKWQGRIDHVFANAGVSPSEDFLDVKLDEAGQLQPPNYRTIDVNFTAVINTIHLAKAYMTELGTHKTAGAASIVLAASASSFQNFTTPDYTISKHGVLGMIRGLVGILGEQVRINAISPSWTNTGIITTYSPLFERIGVAMQSPDVVARSVVLLFADQQRNGDVIYSWEGHYREVNNQQGGLLEHATGILPNSENEEGAIQKLRAYARSRAEQSQQ